MVKTSGQYPSDKLDQSLVRWPAGMRKQIELQANKHGHSINTEIVNLVYLGLEQSMAISTAYRPTGVVSLELVKSLELFLDDWREKVVRERALAIHESRNTVEPLTQLELKNDFFFRLEQRVPGVAARFDSFLMEAENLGVIAEYGRAVVLRWRTQLPILPSAGYIDAYGSVWLGDAYSTSMKLNSEASGRDYLNNTAQAVAGSVTYYEGSYAPPNVKQGNGQILTINKLLDHAAEWREALGKFVSAMKRAETK